LKSRERHPVVPPRQRSSAGALIFVLLVVIIGAVLAGQGQGGVGDLVLGVVQDRDTLLRNPAVRSVVASRVGAVTDLAADTRGEMRDFEVKKGETASDVSRRLATESLIRDRIAFLLPLYDDGHEDDIQAGIHRVSPAMTPREIGAVLIQKAPEDQATLRTIEGWRLTQIATEVAKVFPKITKEAFLQAAVVGKRADPALAGLDPATPLEGFLFPDTYFFKKDASVETIIVTMLTTFESRAGAGLRQAAAQRKTTVYDLVKLASIVEREARDRKESPVIAGVYANRLKLGMKLDADPTIQYALGEWRELTLDDLKLDSPYNTYKVAGLPPTPICGPGLAALQAAQQPQQHDFLYFVAKSDGTGDHLFAKTLEEQEANRLKVGNR
jgi:UPF0755 protein